jgi:hypothetical protein
MNFPSKAQMNVFVLYAFVESIVLSFTKTSHAGMIIYVNVYQ